MAVKRIDRRRHAIAAVAPDLRHPALWFPAAVTSRRSLRVGRVLTSLPTMVVKGVRASRRSVPGRPGEPPVEVTAYEPDRRARPSGGVIWLHGGGTVMGHPRLGHDSASRLARDLGVVVLSVHYRLAPEHPFPAALHDCAAALDWIAGDGSAELGVAPDRIAVGGESAGGLLAASLCQLAHDDGGPGIAFQALAYPMLDDRTVLRADVENREILFWTPRANQFAWTAYLGHTPADQEDPPHGAPARRVDLGGMPPTWLGVGDLDLFFDEGVDYAQRLRRAGVPTELRVVSGMYHGADALRPSSATATAFRSSLTEALRPHVTSPDVTGY